jgi:hypothetical protein
MWRSSNYYSQYKKPADTDQQKNSLRTPDFEWKIFQNLREGDFLILMFGDFL